MMNNPFAMFGNMANNPVMQLVQLVRNGGNPMDMLGKMAGQNPQIAQAMRMMQGKTPQQLQKMAQNMASERGVDIGRLMQDLGIQTRK